MNITFHTFRHSKATMEYHQTKGILHVMQLLGHERTQNTLIHTQPADFHKEDEYACKAAKTANEAKTLIASGFEYVCDIGSVKLLKKRK